MPHFKVSLEPVSISITSAALGPDVWPSLRMARAALDSAIADEIAETGISLVLGIDRLKAAAAETIRALRAARKAALKVREADLPSDEPTSGHKIVTGLQEAIAHAKGETGPSEPAPAEAA